MARKPACVQGRPAAERPLGRGANGDSANGIERETVPPADTETPALMTPVPARTPPLMLRAEGVVILPPVLRVSEPEVCV